MRSLFLGVLFIVIVGIGGLVYRNAIEYPTRSAACPLDAFVCPDGTTVSRTGPACSFPTCPPPNVSLAEVGIAFAVPTGFSEATPPDAVSVAAYEMSAPSAGDGASIVIRRYEIAASSTALATIQRTAIGGASGKPVGITSFSSTELGTHRFTVVSIERFEGVIDTAYYLARGNDVLRFDAVDRGVEGWTDPTLAVSSLPAHAALLALLAALQGKAAE